MDPERFIATARIDENLRIELAAREPNVVDPVAIAFDAAGRMYAVEMRDYPSEPQGVSKPLGRVKLLEDTDLDGYYEKATVFADGLQYPTSVLPWRDGVLVTSPPDIVFFKDTNGDGKADIKEVLFSGFPVANTQHNVNGLFWGLDNWVYAANGGNNGGLLGQISGQKGFDPGHGFPLPSGHGRNPNLLRIHGRLRHCHRFLGPHVRDTQHEPYPAYGLSNRIPCAQPQTGCALDEATDLGP